MGDTSLEMQVISRGAIKTSTSIAPSVLQGLEVLALPVGALSDYLAKAVEANPLLEMNYDDGLLAFNVLPNENDYEDILVSESQDKYQQFSSHRFERLLSGQSREWDFSRIQDDYTETETLQEHLRFQASCLRLSSHEEELVDAVLEGISEDGYYTGDLGVMAFEHGVDIDEAERILAIVQSMQPSGVGARSLSECLMLQIDHTDPYAESLAILISDYLTDLAENRLSFLAKKLGVDMDGMLAMRRSILDMNPRPGASFYQKMDTRYIVPDLIVHRQGVRLSVEVAGGPILSLNTEYATMAENQCLEAEARRYLAQKREEADRLLRNLDQRSHTLQRFGMFLVERQFRFFMGSGGLVPMNMQQAADVLDVHVSTISRTVQGKYIQAPQGTFPLKMFFTRSLPRNDGLSDRTGVSSFDIKHMIQEIVNKEDKQHPLSDAKITEVLNGRGIHIKRRTVAKYRESIGIESQTRRRWANPT